MLLFSVHVLWWHLPVPTRGLALKVSGLSFSGSSNLEPCGGGRRRRQNGRTRRSLCTEPKQSKWQRRQMVVSDPVIDWTRLVLFSQTGNKWHIQVADAVPAYLFPSRLSDSVFSVEKLLFFNDFFLACVHFIIPDFLTKLYVTSFVLNVTVNKPVLSFSTCFICSLTTWNPVLSAGNLPGISLSRSLSLPCSHRHSVLEEAC